MHTWTSCKCDTGKGSWTSSPVTGKTPLCRVCSQGAIQASTWIQTLPSVGCHQTRARHWGCHYGLAFITVESPSDNTLLEGRQIFILRIRCFLYDFRFMIRNVSNCFRKFSYRVMVLKQVFLYLNGLNWKTSWDPKASYLKTKQKQKHSCYNLQVIIYENRFFKYYAFKAKYSSLLNTADNVTTAMRPLLSTSDLDFFRYILIASLFLLTLQ